jgi:hypothetical protein
MPSQSTLLAAAGVTLALFVTAGCGCPSTPPKTSTSAWQPNWETTPDKTKKAKAELSSTVTFSDWALIADGGSPVLDNEEQKRLWKKDTLDKELVLQAFKRLPECKGITFLRTNPKAADFDVQIDNGLEGRIDKWQWVLYRSDISERLAFGEEGDVTSATKSVCMGLRSNLETIGGKVE